MDQVRELLDIVEAQKIKGVTGASIMFSFFKRRVQPIQQRQRLGFEYTGPTDPSRMCAEELSDEATLQRVQRVLLDVDAVPYVPTLFSARNPPKPVSIRLLFVGNNLCYSITYRKNLLQGHTELYRSYPPRPDIPLPDHLLPSAAVEAKRARIAAAQRSSGSAEDVSSQAGEEAEEETRPDNPSEPIVELTGALPLAPQGHRIGRKRKAQEVESSGYLLFVVLYYHMLILCRAYDALL
jgi:hypothetical protein